MKTIFTILISFSLVVCGYSQTRNVLVDTGGTIIQPTNFWTANASNGRSGLGLGSAATNPSSSFQPSSSVLSNLSIGNGVNLTNILYANLSGTVSIANGGTGSTNASNARTALGLGTAATNPASAFQASSSVLSNLATANGGSLTNIQAANIVGTIPSSNIPNVTFTNVSGTLTIAQGGTSATNASNARQNLGATTVGDAVFTATNAESARTAINALAPNGNATNLTNFPVSLLRVNGSAASLTNFPALNQNTTGTASNVTGVVAIVNGGTGATNASTARTELGLGTAATNPASAFQASSSVLSNLASSNGINLTNIQATNIVGLVAGTFYSNNVQNFVSDVSNATNTVTNSRNVTVYSIFPTVNTITNTLQLPTSNAIAGDLARIIHTGPTNSLTRVRKIGETTNIITLNQTSEAAVFVYNGTNWLVLPNSAQTTPIYFSGTNASANAAASRTNFGLGATNDVVFNSLSALSLYGTPSTNPAIDLDDQWLVDANAGEIVFEWSDDTNTSYKPLSFNNTTNAAITRTNLGLGWSALTNSNAGTRLVSVDSNGSVVSPTNFWQAAPIASNLQTIVQTFSPTTNSTNAATNGRNVYVYSLSTNVSGITNTITLPTNAATIAGDNVTVTHQGLTNSATAIRRLGETNNLITINNLDEAVKFIYENGAWTFYHNISFVEPIRFSGTNASVNAAASRTNLGVPSSFGGGSNSVIGGGLSNSASGIGATVSGGVGNAAGGAYSAVAGGSNNSANSYGFVGGGYDNSVFSLASVIGGNGNNASGQASSIMGGGINTASGQASSIMGSLFSGASGINSAVIGGNFSSASGHYSVAIGRSSSATNNNSFVWSDGQGFSSTNTNSFNVSARGGMSLDLGTNGIIFRTNASADATRTNLGLGATNQVTFSRLYISNTNVGPFEGLANLINSNNTTLSNETLFRVGLAEDTNRSAQFGFRVARTNNGGEGFATFSVFGYNALMMIGPSDRSRTNTATNAGIEADIFSISETNRVATLIDTNTGAFTLHRPIGFRTNETNASPAAGNTFGDRARWLQIHVGTNTFYIPLFQ